MGGPRPPAVYMMLRLYTYHYKPSLNQKSPLKQKQGVMN